MEVYTTGFTKKTAAQFFGSFKKQKGSWSDYEQRFLALMKERRVEDGTFTVDLSVTDIRLCETDHKTPKENLIRQVDMRMKGGAPVILSVGLSRPWRQPDDTVERHWLQVNNIHLKI